MSAKKIYFLVVSVFVICQVSATDYCKIEGCEPGKHIKCLYPDNTVSSSCGNVTATGISDFHKKSLVDSINANRNNNYRENRQNRHQNWALVDMSWSDDLAEIAQRWANQCTTSQVSDGCNTLIQGKAVYQRIYEGPNVEVPNEVVENIWNKDEILNVTDASTNYLLVDKVGCGRVLATKGKYLVCLFSDSWVDLID